MTIRVTSVRVTRGSGSGPLADPALASILMQEQLAGLNCLIGALGREQFCLGQLMDALFGEESFHAAHNNKKIVLVLVLVYYSYITSAKGFPSLMSNMGQNEP
jgi:hypothetical protein